MRSCWVQLLTGAPGSGGGAGSLSWPCICRSSAPWRSSDSPPQPPVNIQISTTHRRTDRGLPDRVLVALLLLPPVSRVDEVYGFLPGILRCLDVLGILTSRHVTPGKVITCPGTGWHLSLSKRTRDANQRLDCIIVHLLPSQRIKQGTAASSLAMSSLVVFNKIKDLAFKLLLTAREMLTVTMLPVLLPVSPPGDWWRLCWG